MDENEVRSENQTGGPAPRESEEAWKEVGQQFKTLGESLAHAFRSAWNSAVENEETQRQAQELQKGLKSMVDEVDRAIREAASSTEGQKIQQEVQRAAESARTAGKKTFEELQPHLLSALQQVNSELQKLMEQIEQTGRAEQTKPADTPPPTPPSSER